MQASWITQLKALIYKENLLLKRDCKRIFLEFFLPIIIATSTFSSVVTIGWIKVDASSLLEEGYEASSSRTSDFQRMYPIRDYTECYHPNKYIGLVSNDLPFAEAFQQNLEAEEGLKFLTFESVEIMQRYAQNPGYGENHTDRNELCIGIQFDFDDKSKKYSYVLYTDKNSIPQSEEQIYDPYGWAPDLTNFKKLKLVGSLQGTIDSLLLTKVTQNESAFISYAYAPMYTNEYKTSLMPTYSYISSLCTLGIVAATIALQMLIGRLQYEKVNKIRDFMRILGLTDTPYFLSYLFFYMITSFISSVVITLALFLMIFHQTNLIVLWFTNYLLLLTAFSFAILMNSLFKSIPIARVVGSLSYLLLYFFILPLTIVFTSSAAKFALSLIPPVGYALVIGTIFNLNLRGDCGWSQISTDIYHYSISEGWAILFLNLVIYLCLGLYLDNVLPGMGGVRKPLNYFLTTNYWAPKRRIEPSSQDREFSSDRLIDKDSPVKDPNTFEEVDPSFKLQEETGECLIIKQITKKYEDGKIAVNNLSLNIYKGEVFLLLGHNGAGKTTLISMLTGLLAPTSGKAMFHENDIFENLDRLRGLLGVCPQESIFYENLTVEEHLEIFAKLKNLNYDLEKERLEIIMKNLDFFDSIKVKAMNLSGGQKRKLSVLISLVGSPEILMLDEPTSGLDVSARQKIWEVIQELKKNSLVFMTTHYMDEAEQLGDRIAIMSEGEIKCCGSSMFLKNRYGSGYKLTLVKQESNFNEPLLTEIINAQIPTASKESESLTEIVFKLPFSSSRSFAQLFKNIDNAPKPLGISSYGVEITSLEDIFLKIGAEEEIPHKKQTISMQQSLGGPTDSFKGNEEENIIKPSTFDKIRAMIWVNWMQTIRTPRLLINEMILPVLLLLLAMTNTSYTPSRTISYTPNLLPFPQTFPINNVSRYKQDTSRLFDIDSNYHAAPFFLDYPENSNIVDIAQAFDWNVSNSSDFSSYYGAYYINSFNETQLQALILGKPTCAHCSSFFAHLLAKNYFKTINSDIQINMAISPIDMYTSLGAKIKEIVMIFLFIFYTIIGFVSSPSSMIYCIVKERKEQKKFYLLISGLHPMEYWFAKFLADYIKLFIPLILIIIFKFIMEVNIPFYALIIIITLLAVLPFSYLLSFLFNNENLAMTLTLLFNVILGLPAALIINIMLISKIMSGVPVNSLVIANVICKIFPFYNMASVLTISAFDQLYRESGIEIFSSPTDFNYLGSWILMVAISSIVSWLMIWSLESCKRWRESRGIGLIPAQERTAPGIKDNDVQQEEQQVAMQDPTTVAVQVGRARKVYGFLKAVDDLSLSVHYKDVFALLGVNGAGKTTTFKMLTRQEKPTCGRFFMHGIDVYSPEFSQLSSHISYCSQDNLLFDELSPKEHIELFASIKGIPKEKRQVIIDKLLASFNFGDDYTKRSEKLSGGNKRKLCMALTVLGQPSILLLDEPTTGLDPKNRREVWKVIKNVSASCGVVITTHSMEEVEALATKVGIMVKGNFRCYGPVQHLKTKYGDSYEIELKLAFPSLLESVEGRLNVPENTLVNNLDQAKYYLDQMGYNEEAKLISMHDFRASHIIEKIIKGTMITVKQIVEFAAMQRNSMEIIESVKNFFGECFLNEQLASKLKIRVPRIINEHFVSLASIFEYAETLREEGKILDYMVSQTTLEQIFHYFARGGEGRP